MPAPTEAPVPTEQSIANDAPNDAGLTPITSESAPAAFAAKPVEIGGPSGPEPTRYGDWEKGGRCIDF